MISVEVRNAPHALIECLWRLRVYACKETSRNGDVMTLPEPFSLTVLHPKQRVVTCPVRNANPFFHVMEFVWMMAGRRDTEFVCRFNKNMSKYSDDTETFHAAYGHRWRQWWSGDQILSVIDLLKCEPTTRRAVISMWDPDADLLEGQFLDHPCNTQLMFRVQAGELNMLVTNRSNDLVWGMAGANIVHMTLLHELIAKASGLRLGAYTVVSNNMHFYLDMPNAENIWALHGPHDMYQEEGLSTMPVLFGGETYRQFRRAAEQFCNNPDTLTGVMWIDGVAGPLYHAYMEKDDLVAAKHHANRCLAEDWRWAAQDWLNRNRGNK